MNDEQLATLALWSIAGIGPKTLEAIELELGPLGALADLPIGEWLPRAQIARGSRRELGWYSTLRQCAEETLRETERADLIICFRGDPAWPSNLSSIDQGPPLLWHVGPGAQAPPRRRLAMVGTRQPEQGFRRFVDQLIDGLVHGHPVGVVSGLARGIDQWCHSAATAAGAETWAFVGSGLAALDGGLWEPAFELLDGGGTLFSEFPPLKRADRTTFPRRNRLISGASDAVLMLRGGTTSGALYTVEAARAQGRPTLAIPGEAWNEKASGCNALLCAGLARAVVDANGLHEALGLTGRRAAEVPRRWVDPRGLSPFARTALERLGREPCDLEALQSSTGLDASAVSTALSELVLRGLAVQRPGSLYERA